MERHGDEPGLRPYWACGTCPPRRAVLPPRNLGYAATLVSGRIVDPIFPDDYPDVEAPAPSEQFDADASDPARFVDRLCDRLATVQATVVDQERQRRIDGTERDVGGTEQAGLSGWSA